MAKRHKGASVRLGPRTAYLLRVAAALSNRSLKDVVSDALARTLTDLPAETLAYATLLSDDITSSDDSGSV